MCDVSLTPNQLEGKEFGDLTASISVDDSRDCKKCKEESFIEIVPGVDPEKITSYPSWCDASYRDFYEVVISNLPIEITKEMILQSIPSAEEKYTLVIKNTIDRKIVVLRFGPFYSQGLKNYYSAKKIFNENVKFLKIRTYPPSIKILGIPAYITKPQMEEVFTESSKIQLETIGEKTTVILEHATFDSSRRSYNRLKRSLTCDWLTNCHVVQIPERVDEITLSDSDSFMHTAQPLTFAE
ncbi:unnamed protein product [Allacma fusca]|uniref:Uncharacterized protein n=1 Tax=Allacma fusca TaxID=39272 RepID=A0A8J2Q6T8_9HEXA|nr:unnamed protein product [Allacma fusca]